MSQLETIINEAFENRNEISPKNVTPEIKEAIAESLELLNTGTARVAEKKDGGWGCQPVVEKSRITFF